MIISKKQLVKVIKQYLLHSVTDILINTVYLVCFCILCYFLVYQSYQPKIDHDEIEYNNETKEITFKNTYQLYQIGSKVIVTLKDNNNGIFRNSNSSDLVLISDTIKGEYITYDFSKLNMNYYVLDKIINKEDKYIIDSSNILLSCLYNNRYDINHNSIVKMTFCLEFNSKGQAYNKILNYEAIILFSNNFILAIAFYSFIIIVLLNLLKQTLLISFMNDITIPLLNIIFELSSICILFSSIIHSTFSHDVNIRNYLIIDDYIKLDNLSLNYFLLKIFFSITLFTTPFRFLIIISYLNFKLLISYLNIIFRIMKPCLIILFIFHIIILPISYGLYIAFRDISSNHSTLMDSYLNTFQILFSSNLNKSLSNNQSLYYPYEQIAFYYIYLIFISLILILSITIIISSISILFSKSSIEEIRFMTNNANSKVKTKISLIENQIEELIHKHSLKELSKLVKKNKTIHPQILWLNACNDSNSNYFYSKFLVKNQNRENFNLVYFTSSNQVISYLKYIFAIKPRFQFRRTHKRFLIVIVFNNCKDDIDYIEDLINFVNYSTAKINVVFYKLTGKINQFERLNLTNACNFKTSICASDSEIESEINTFIGKSFVDSEDEAEEEESKIKENENEHSLSFNNNRYEFVSPDRFSRSDSLSPIKKLYNNFNNKNDQSNNILMPVDHNKNKNISSLIEEVDSEYSSNYSEKRKLISNKSNKKVTVGNSNKSVNRVHKSNKKIDKFNLFNRKSV